MPTRITKRLLDATKPGERDAFLWDNEVKGFGLKVTPKGRRIYLLQARVKGRVRRYTIGVHGSPWTAELARDEAIRLRGEIAGGDDPADAKAKEGRDMTVSALCDLYLKEGFATKKASTEAVERGLIARHIKPLLRNRTLASLGKGDIERFLADVAAGKTAIDEKTKKRGRAIVTGGKGTANRTTALLASMLSFAADRGYMPSNPARGVRPYRLAARERFLSASELKALGDPLSACEAEGQNALAIAAIRLLLLTGCRKNEVLGLQWNWIDFTPDGRLIAGARRLAAVRKLGWSQVPVTRDPLHSKTSSAVSAPRTRCAKPSCRPKSMQSGARSSRRPGLWLERGSPGKLPELARRPATRSPSWSVDRASRWTRSLR